ncbi:MAG: AAA family ATPase [Alloprevotella sp.]|nr:AAA family ATPase [Alloprevotella sp.]MBR1594993.1 AAA family ATPase [Alloprevotella sp.]
MSRLQRHRELLRKEYEYEKEQFRHDAELLGVERKVRRGECWYPVSVGRSYYNSLDRLAVEVVRPQQVEDEETPHSFEYGRTVCFFEQDGTGGLHYASFTATVNYVEGDTMTVLLPDEKALESLRHMEQPGVQLFFDETTYHLMFKALDDVLAARDNRLAELRDKINASVALPEERPQHLSLPWLNASQQQAVSDIVGTRDFLVVHGPPGTGKTTTLVEAVAEVLQRETQVLVCAQSNTAVDWIAEQLSARGIPLLRIGNPTRVTPSMLAHTYERRFEDHPDYPALWQLRRTLRQLRSTPRGSRPQNFHQKIARLRERADEIEIRIRQQLFDATRVFACTLAGSANPLLMGMRFHTLFIDEAAQALEAACWIAIRKCDRFVLAGDHCQLPPTIKNPQALRDGLGRTLMEAIVDAHPERVRLLRVQYRMNERLMRFSSDWFYGGQLEAAPEVRHRSLLDMVDTPLEWIDTGQSDAEGEEATQETSAFHTHSRQNPAEARLTLETLRRYVQRIGMERLLEERVDFGIISPYRGQVSLLRRLLKRDETLRPLRRQITVSTVDAFQGQERDVIVLSLVRANDAGQIGFLRDLRRTNVAITRARYKLIVLGDVSTLCRHKFYRRLYEACVE